MLNTMRCSLIIIAACASTVSAQPQSIRLPISEGVWVKTDTKCETAYIAHVYAGKVFGTVYFYGPKQTMGPSNETEPLSRVVKVGGGFTMVNEGPLEVAARPNGQAIVRANSPSQGVQWSEIVRLCPAAALSLKFRTALSNLGLITAAKRK